MFNLDFGSPQIWSLGKSMSRAVSAFTRAMVDGEISGREVMLIANNLVLVMRDLGIEVSEEVYVAIETGDPEALLQLLIDKLGELKVKVR